MPELSEAHINLQLFSGYASSDLAILEEFADPNARHEPGFLVDFVGSRIRASSVWKQAREFDGQLLPMPVPADFHAEAVEWIGLLKAVRSASERFVAMELGAGFGPWIIAGALAAKRKNIQDIQLLAVEGDPEHFKSLRQHFTDNDFEPTEHTLLQAGVGVSRGVAEWPVLDDACEFWGCRPLKDGRDYLGCQFQRTTQVDIVPMRELVLRKEVWDLIHIDVQGEEVEICRSCLAELNARARWIIVGTHSRKLDGDFVELMCKAGWLLEHEKPSKFNFVPHAASLEAMTLLDGTQVWRNPRLLRAGEHLTFFSQQIDSSIRELTIAAGEIQSFDVTIKNSGLEPWFGAVPEAPVNLSYCWLDTEFRPLPIEGTRSSIHPAIIHPGQRSTLKLQIAAPLLSGTYTLQVSMVQEGVAWFHHRGGEPLTLKVIVN